jgi:hypothetical protein
VLWVSLPVLLSVQFTNENLTVGCYGYSSPNRQPQRGWQLYNNSGQFQQLFPIFRINNNRDGPIIHQLHLHIRREHACLYFFAQII